MSESDKKIGRPPGTTKADRKDGVVKFRCDRGDKGRWVREARRRGMTLSALIIEVMNGETADGD